MQDLATLGLPPDSGSIQRRYPVFLRFTGASNHIHTLPLGDIEMREEEYNAFFICEYLVTKVEYERVSKLLGL